MILSIIVCLSAFAGLVWLVRSRGVSFGLPIAYLIGLLIIHLPGAVAHLLSRGFYSNSEFTETGIAYTAVGCVCFVVGVWIARRNLYAPPVNRAVDRHEFSVFCLGGGWIATYGMGPLAAIPSIGAAVTKSGAIWMLGVMLGLRDSIAAQNWPRALLWLGALGAYPVLALLLGGFLSHSSTAVTIVLCVLAVSARRGWKVALGIVVTVFFAFNMSIGYLKNRDDIRDSVWGQAPLVDRIAASLSIFTDFQFFDPSNEEHLTIVENRLNQNYFVGLASSRIDDRQVDFLYGKSVSEGLIALVPRALWPEKPVLAGSPKVVAEMTGLVLSENTSFGVGNVMEFYINFGVAGLVVGFLALGWAIGILDRKAATAEALGDFERIPIYFLTAVALIQPNGSMVELASGGAAAVAASYGWTWAWKQWSARRRRTRVAMAAIRRRP